MTLPPILIAVLALALVLALILLAGRIARFGLRVPRPGPEGRLKLEQVLALDPRRRLHLVKCDDKHVLLLTGGAQDVVVGWLP